MFICGLRKLKSYTQKIVGEKDEDSNDYSWVFAVPAVKGGAVEVLIEELLKENEIENKCTIDCYTIDDENIQKRGLEIQILKQ